MKIDLALAGVGLVTAPLQGATAQLAAHDLTNTAEHSALRTLTQKIGIGALAFRHVRRGVGVGWRSGLTNAEAARAEREKGMIRLHRNDLTEPGRAAQLKRDLETLAKDDRTALDLNNLATSERIHRRVDAAISRPGPMVEIDLASVGIRTAPRLKQALQEYARGGREELVAAGLLGRAGQERSRDRSPDPGMEGPRPVSASGQRNRGAGRTVRTGERSRGRDASMEM